MHLPVTCSQRHHRYIYASAKRTLTSTTFSLFALESSNPSDPLGPYRWAGWLAPGTDAIVSSYFEWYGASRVGRGRGDRATQCSDIMHAMQGWQGLLFVEPV